MATTLSVLVLSIPRLNFLAGDKALAMTFALSAGVMLFITLVDLFLESIEKLSQRREFAVGGSEGVDLGGSLSTVLRRRVRSRLICDKTCAGHAWLATVGCFYGGMSSSSSSLEYPRPQACLTTMHKGPRRRLATESRNVLEEDAQTNSIDAVLSEVTYANGQGP